MTESLPQWQPGVAPPSDPFLAKTNNLFEQLKQQVELSLQITMNREAAERAESKRIAELFPIEWHSDQTESSESPRYAARTEEPIRTPSPSGNQLHDASPESPRFPISGISQSDTATRRYSPIRKSIFKTPALSFVKEELQAKTGSAKSIKSLRNHFSKQSQFRELELPQSPPTKCGLFSNHIQFPAPYGLS
eukprot:CAMPEP_0172162894 /NCGR_PEP_ID=MMETSP1050-20130122/6955_1 /TAXON_ID=233186 /ORGANISM="Cryptomonas curvata, Strain CCAP979/52" /LENGTH=191 /DNA_ID=CAMNT_0012832995 /DNA_START=78 /DNA_END=653 /DNA_ORIENTATION=+